MSGPIADQPELQRIIEDLRRLPGALLPILRAVQERFGFIDDAAVPVIAEALNLSRAEVHGVITFYHDFRRTPAGSHVLKLCRAEACQSMGCEALADALRRRHGIAFGETSADGRLTLEAVYCLGNCALAPAAMLDGKTHGRLDAAKVATLLKSVGALA
jgi:formate dehydrogenase subunit gamma